MSDPSPWSRRDPEDPSPPEGDSDAVPAAPDEPVTIAADHATAEAAGTGKPTTGPGVSGALLPILGLMLMALATLVVGLVVFLTREEKQGFPANRNEADYDLPAMALRNTDLPSGMELFGRVAFDNEKWADIVGGDDPETKLAQLNASGRIRNNVNIFRWADDTTGTRHFGETISLIAQSTVFNTVESAKESISGRAGSTLKPFCGLAVNDQNEIRDFPVPKIGDQSAGFRVISLDEPLRISQDIAIPIGTGIETVVCFRTGSVVHGIIQNARQGGDDIALVVGLAQRMLERAKNEFAGDPDPLDKPSSDGG